ncbi:hypothetical protein HDU67_007240 [Dinochytrium kinnereticum]|nr:hypothetical protein HDU67_007240 [Dinochytrium kinnereticum]
MIRFTNIDGKEHIILDVVYSFAGIVIQPSVDLLLFAIAREYIQVTYYNEQDRVFGGVRVKLATVYQGYSVILGGILILIFLRKMWGLSKVSVKRLGSDREQRKLIRFFIKKNLWMSAALFILCIVYSITNIAITTRIGSLSIVIQLISALSLRFMLDVIRELKDGNVISEDRVTGGSGENNLARPTFYRREDIALAAVPHQYRRKRHNGRSSKRKGNRAITEKDWDIRRVDEAPNVEDVHYDVEDIPENGWEDSDVIEDRDKQVAPSGSLESSSPSSLSRRRTTKKDHSTSVLEPSAPSTLSGKGIGLGHSSDFIIASTPLSSSSSPTSAVDRTRARAGSEPIPRRKASRRYQRKSHSAEGADTSGSFLSSFERPDRRPPSAKGRSIFSSLRFYIRDNVQLTPSIVRDAAQVATLSTATSTSSFVEPIEQVSPCNRLPPQVEGGRGFFSSRRLYMRDNSELTPSIAKDAAPAAALHSTATSMSSFSDPKDHELSTNIENHPPLLVVGSRGPRHLYTHSNMQLTPASSREAAQVATMASTTTSMSSFSDPLDGEPSSNIVINRAPPPAEGGRGFFNARRLYIRDNVQLTPSLVGSTLSSFTDPQDCDALNRVPPPAPGGKGFFVGRRGEEKKRGTVGLYLRDNVPLTVSLVDAAAQVRTYGSGAGGEGGTEGDRGEDGGGKKGEVVHLSAIATAEVAAEAKLKGEGAREG